MRILIVEDNRRLAESLKDIVKSLRYESDISPEGPEGLDRMMSGLYDGVILDVMLPGMDGTGASEKSPVRRKRDARC